MKSIRLLGTYLLLLAAFVFSEAKSRAQETLISTGSLWSFHKGTNEASSPVTLWRSNNFNDATWTVASAPFQYGYSGGTVLSDMRNNYTCIFLRKTFVVTNVATIASVVMLANYDDGFVAWVNGTEVARNGASSSPTYNAIASINHGAGTFENFVNSVPQTYLVNGTNVLTVQGFNRSLTASTDFYFDGTLQVTRTTPLTILNIAPAAGATVGSLTQLTVTFSKPVFGVDAADLLVNNQPAAGLIGIAGTNVYTFTFTQPLPGDISVKWDEIHDITDAAGVPFDATAPGATWSYTYADTLPPTVNECTPVTGAQVSQLTQVEITFSEPVVGVDATDLLINGSSATNVSGSGAGPYVFQFPQPSGGTVQFAWAIGHGIVDIANTPNAFAGGNWSVTLNPGVSPGDVIINEFVAGNTTGLLDEDGERQDWIEIYNRGTNTVNLLGWSLTEDAAVPGKWVFPSTNLAPGQFLVVFASEKDRRVPGARLHTNFKLDLFGEYLALFNAESPRVAVSEFAPEFPEQRNNYSYGRDNSDVWRYYATPTPGAANGNSAIIGIAPQPHFSVERGLFDAPFNLILTTTLPAATIRYTTDGSEPTAVTGFVYSSPIQITNTAMIRAASFLADYLPSRSATRTYIFPNHVLAQPKSPSGFPSNWGTRTGYEFPNNLVPADYEMDLDPVRVDPNNPASAIDPVKLQRLKDGLRELPVVSVVMNTADMFGSGGIYYYPNVTSKSFGQKPCSVEMILPDGTSAFETTCGIGMHGNASRQPEKNPKHGFKLKFKGDFGPGNLKYRVFPESPVAEYDNLILRADFGVSWRHQSDTGTEGLGNFQRTRATRTRDAFIKDTGRVMGVVASHSRFCNLFINGIYWGTYDFTEQPGDSFAAGQFGGEKEDYDIYEQGALESGQTAAYVAMTSISDLSVNANYEAMKQYLDMTEFIDYLLLHYFVGAQDWGYDANKNWYALRNRAAGGTFKYVPWDGENILLDTNINQVTAAHPPSDLHPKLLANPQYKLDFADRVHKQMIAPDGPLTAAANIARWSKWMSVLDKPIVAESARWGDYRRDVHPSTTIVSGPTALYTREEYWLVESNRVASVYLPGRNATVLSQLRSAGLYPSFDAPEYRQNNVAGAIVGNSRVASGFMVAMKNPGGAGTIYYTTNGTDPRVYYLGTVAPAAASYSTPLALNSTLTIKSRVLNGGTWSALNEATFTIGGLGVPLAITEIMYNPAGGNQYEFLELQNISAQPLDVSGFSFQGITFTIPNGTVLAPGAVLLLANNANPAQFAARYPSVAVFGYYSGNLDNGGERIAILDANGNTVTAVNYDDEAGWPTSPDGGGYSLEVIDPRGDPNSPANWRASSALNGTPGLPPVTPPLGDVVLNEIAADNASSVTNDGAFPDWVELYNRSASPVNLANWSLSDSGNARKYIFPATNIAADSYLVVWCDTNNAAPGLHAGFSLSKSGENVFLYDANTNRVDAVSFGAQLTDYSIGRIADEWQLTVSTPNAVNIAATLAPSAEVAINEWMATAGTGLEDWIELFNRSSDAPVALRGLYLGTSNALCQIRSLSFLPPHGYIQLFADELPGANHLEFKLPSAGGAIVLSDETGLDLEHITYGSQTTGVSEGRLPDGSASIAAFPGSVSPGASNYLLIWSGPVLNEVLARNGGSALAPWGNYADWIEIYNPSNVAVSVSGMALGESTAVAGRWIIPSGVTIPANGYLRVWCDSSHAASSSSGLDMNTGFSFSSDSDAIYLFNNLGQSVDWVQFGFQVQDLSIGRSGGEWKLLATPTPGANNSAPAALGSVADLRINEWMATPLSGDDWFEVYNSNALPVDMTGLYLTDNPSSQGTTQFQIAPLSFIDGQKWVKWEASGDASLGRNHVNFALSKQGETIRLYATNLALIDAVDFGIQDDDVSQGRLPDGGVDIVNFPLTPSPGAANYLPLPPIITSTFQNLSVPAGTNLTLTVIANGSGPLTYQWFFNSQPIVGATDTNYLLFLVQPTNAGLYSAQAANAIGTNFTDLVNLTVLVPPAPTLIPTFVPGAQFNLAWPTGAVVYTLYSSSNLGPAAIWTPVIPAPGMSNGQFRAIISPTNAQQFFRLSQP